MIDINGFAKLGERGTLSGASRTTTTTLGPLHQGDGGHRRGAIEHCVAYQNGL